MRPPPSSQTSPVPGLPSLFPPRRPWSGELTPREKTLWESTEAQGLKRLGAAPQVIHAGKVRSLASRALA